MSYDWMQSSMQFRFEQRVAFSVIDPKSYTLITGITDHGSRPKPRVYDFRERQSRDTCRARI